MADAQGDVPDDGWHTLPEAARHLGVSVATVRRRLKRGELEGTQVPSRYGPAWHVRLPAVQGSAQGNAQGSPSRVNAAAQGGVDYSVPAIVEALRLVRHLQEQNQQLAGQVGFLQAQLEATREQLRLQAPGASPDIHQERQSGQRDVEPEREAVGQERRPWWKLW